MLRAPGCLHEGVRCVSRGHASRLPAAVLCVAAIAGCGSSNSSSSSSTSAPAAVELEPSSSTASSRPPRRPIRGREARPGRDQVEGHADRRRRRELRARRVLRPRRAHGDRDGRRPDEGARRRDGPEGQRQSTPRSTSIIAGHRGGQVRRRRVVVHRHQGAREDRRLRHLRRASGSRSSRRPRAAPQIASIADICGHTVAVEKGTTEQTDAATQSAKCKKAGKPAVTVLVFPDQNGANLALASGRAQLVFADSPPAAYAVKKSNGQFKLVGAAVRDRAPTAWRCRRATGSTRRSWPR